MLKIRLKRTGRKNRPYYKIVLMQSLSKRDGKAILDLGYYDPILKEARLEKALVHKYINCGARPTDTVRHLIAKYIA
jgi:small subunit ribosomal protein S16